MTQPLRPSLALALDFAVVVCRRAYYIEERARLRARARGCARGVLVEGGARNADVSTKLNLPFPGVHVLNGN